MKNLNARIDAMNDLKSKTIKQMNIHVDVNAISPEQRLEMLREIMSSFDYAGVRVKGLNEKVPDQVYIPKTIEVAIDEDNIKMGKTSNPTIVISVNIEDGSYVRKGN